MTTRRRSVTAKQAASGNENTGQRRSATHNTSARQSSLVGGAAATKAAPKRQQQQQQKQAAATLQNDAATAAAGDQPMAGGDPFDDCNISDDEEGGTRIGDIYIPPPVPPYCSTESKGARLIIKKIENNNFKSYAGKVILGPFHHVSTAVLSIVTEIASD